MSAWIIAAAALVFVVVGIALQAYLTARHRRCSTWQVVREAFTIQRDGGTGEER